jgi:hypothetical protein
MMALPRESERLTWRYRGLAEGFTDDFIDRLFELVETSRNFDEELNYAVIRLIVRVPTLRKVWLHTERLRFRS